MSLFTARSRRALCALLTLSACLAGVAAPATPVQRANAADGASGPKMYYLALGDSLAYGQQPNRDLTHGYADDLFSYLKPLGSRDVVDMGCPSETSATFVNGGCRWQRVVRYAHGGSQLQAALAFIAAHPGQVSPVTLDLGTNDLGLLYNPFTCTTSSARRVAQVLAAFDNNLARILSQLHAALNGAGDLLVMTNYFARQNQCPSLLPLAQTFNAHITAIGRQSGALVAPVFDAFGGATTPNPNLCAYTWSCSPYRDIHGTASGYALIARTMEQALRYAA